MSETVIEVQELQEMLAEGRPVTVVDVRHASDYQDWMVPGSLNVDVYDALKAKSANAMEDVKLPGDRPVITV